MKYLLTLFLALTASTLTAQSPYEIAMQKGQAAYNQGDYSSAATFWEKGKKYDGADIKKLNGLLWKTRDDDGDGFVNGRDKCPKSYYSSNGGCPPVKPKDSDEDGIQMPTTFVTTTTAHAASMAARIPMATTPPTT